MTDPESERAQSREGWNDAAAGWKANADAIGRVLMPVAEWLVDAIAPQPGHTLLELAAGTGEVGFLAAELIEPGGELICSDFSPKMLTAAQERAGTLGLGNVRFKQIDAESIDLPAASVDGVLCRFGYMLMVDPNAALRETRRVLKPGATVALATWAERAANPWNAVVAEAAGRIAGLAPPDDDEPGPFRWGDLEVIAGELEAAGFVDFEVETLDFEFIYPSAELWWETQLQMSTRLRSAVDGVDAERLGEIRAAVAEAAAEYETGDGSLGVPARACVARAVA